MEIFFKYADFTHVFLLNLKIELSKNIDINKYIIK